MSNDRQERDEVAGLRDALAAVTRERDALAATHADVMTVLSQYQPGGSPPAGDVLLAQWTLETLAHGHREFPHQIVSSSAPKALRVARRAGWVFHRDGTATCPKCSGRMRVAPMPYRTWVHPRRYAAVREAERTGEAPDPATYVGLPRDEQATDQPEHDRGA